MKLEVGILACNDFDEGQKTRDLLWFPVSVLDLVTFIFCQSSCMFDILEFIDKLEGSLHL